MEGIGKRVKSRSKQRLHDVNKRKKMEMEAPVTSPPKKRKQRRRKDPDSEIEDITPIHNNQVSEMYPAGLRDGSEHNISVEKSLSRIFRDLKVEISGPSSSKLRDVSEQNTGIPESHSSFIRPQGPQALRDEIEDVNNFASTNVSKYEDSVSVNSGKSPVKPSTPELENPETGKEVKPPEKQSSSRPEIFTSGKAKEVQAPEKPSSFRPEIVSSEKAKEVQAPENPSRPEILNSEKAKEVQANNSLWSIIPAVAEGLNKENDAAESNDLPKEASSVKESKNVNVFRVLRSQVDSVCCIFERHPDMASEFRPKNQHLKTAYMNVLLSLIKTMCQSTQELSKDDLTDAYTDLADLTDAGLNLNWLEEKLEEVSEKKKKEEAGETRMQEIEEELKELKQKCSNLEAQLEKEKEDVSVARAPLSFDDVV